MIGIYGLFDAATGECLYVGQSQECEYRFKKHLELLGSGRHPRKDFVQWFADHRGDPRSIEFRLLSKTKLDREVMNRREISWFKRLRPRFYGKQPSTKEKWVHSVETRSRIGLGVSSGTRVESSRCRVFYYDCPDCGALFITRGPRRKHFSCEECLGSRNPRAKSTRERNSCPEWVELECEWCGEVFLVPPRLRHRRFCSRSCFLGEIEYPEESRLRVLYCDQQLSSHGIAKLLGMSPPTVRNLLRKYQIPVRERKTAAAMGLSKRGESTR